MSYTFRFKGPGSHIHDGKDIQPGETFQTDTDIRKLHPDGNIRFELVEDESPKREVSRNSQDTEEEGVSESTPATEPRSSLEIHPRGGGWYDVIKAETGEKINEKALKYDDALKMTEE